MFSLQKGMQTVRAAESLKLFFGVPLCHLTSLAFPLYTQHQIFGPHNLQLLFFGVSWRDLLGLGGSAAGMPHNYPDRWYGW